MPKFNHFNLAIAIGITFLIWVLTGSHSFGFDSSDLRSGFTITKRPSNSLLGTVSDMKICRYHRRDGLIHCHSEITSTGQQEYLATTTERPRFRRYRSKRRGQISTTPGVHYAFSFAQTMEPNSGKTAYIHCKLVLEFELANRDKFWIWHDEIRFLPSGTIAIIDSNGDQHPDLALRGHWTGQLRGVRRWIPVDPAIRGYTKAQMEFPARPAFGTIDGLPRECEPSQVVVASLAPAAPRIGSTVTGEMHTTLGIVDD